MKHKKELFFEEALQKEWVGDSSTVEVPLHGNSFILLRLFVIVAVVVICGRVLFFGMKDGAVYSSWAQVNMNRTERVPAPRGIVRDRFETVLVENKAAFSLLLDLRAFMKDPKVREDTLRYLEDTAGILPEEVWSRVNDATNERVPVSLVLSNELSQEQLVQLKSGSSPAVQVVDSFEREYLKGNIFSSVVGYVGFTTKEDLRADQALSGNDVVGKSGIEAFYDKELRGEPGVTVQSRDARGNPVGGERKTDPRIGDTLTLTLDGEFQEYFHTQLGEGLRRLGRTSGVGIAMDPRNGEVLALMSFPSFDSNVMVRPELRTSRAEMLTAPAKPLFNRAVNGLYAPGSTIKPLVGVAVLTENIISPEREIFSPGYLDIPNPYDPEKPTRYKDWRYQGNVDLSAAIAQSSDVYFYEVTGGARGTKGLGIDRLREWWQKFGLGKVTGIDLPSEGKGFLPSIDWKQKLGGRPWLLGDTYNVSIGQGDLLLTPIQLMNYIVAVANGGTVYRPVLNKNASHPAVSVDLTSLVPQFKEVQKGMREAVTSPLGTAKLLSDLPFEVGAKTGSAQVQNNTQENAFFVGYAPFDHPQIAILILIEHSLEGSLNAVPIAKDVLNWYYENRIKKH